MLVLSKPYQEDTIYLWLLATSSMSGTQLGISDTLIVLGRCTADHQCTGKNLE